MQRNSTEPFDLIAENGIPEVFLVVVIGSAPQNFILREIHRSNFARWQNSSTEKIEYRFFTEKTLQTLDENVNHNDIEYNHEPGGYAGFNERGKLHMKWALSTYRFKFYLRIDDDGVLCLDRLIWQLKTLDPSKASAMLFWGKYWCRAHSSRADENFMLFSHQLAEFIINVLDHFRTSGWTLALNIGAFLIQMKEVYIIDDRLQIEAQQGHIASYMSEPYNSSLQVMYRVYCLEHIWAHHVNEKILKEAITYEKDMVNLSLPIFHPPNVTCGDTYSYNITNFLLKAGVPL